jgi:hypothetical protein
MLKRADWQALQEAQKGATPVQLVFAFVSPHNDARQRGGKQSNGLYCPIAPLPLFEHDREN